MRITYVTPHYTPSIGGVERHVRELARFMVGEGCDVEILTSAVSDAPASETLDGIRIRRFRAWGPTSDLRVPIGLVRALRNRAGTRALLHAHNYHAAAALLAAAAWRGPFVMTPHYHGTGHIALTKALHVPYRLLGSRLLGRSDWVICVTAAEARLVQSRFPNVAARLVVIPNGVDVAGICAADPYSRDIPVVLVAGRLEPHKRVDLTIRAFKHIASSSRLVIVGRGRAEGDLRRLASDCGLLGRVEILTDVSDRELQRWFRTAHVFVTMSQNEAFGLTLAEGLVGGALAVASDIPPHREIAGMASSGRVTLVTPRVSPRELASSIEKHLQCTAATKAATLEILDWADVGARTRAVYDETLHALAT